MDADMQALWERVCARLSRLGAQPGDLAVPAWFEPLARLQTDVMQAEMSRSLSHERLHHAHLFSPRLAGMIDAGLSLDAADHVRHLQQVQDARHAARDLFAHHDLLIAPSTIGEAVLQMEGTGDPLFCRAWTVLGLPCLHLPLGVGRHGLSIGLQLIGPALADQAVLQAGAWLHDRLRD
jgi:Asp-tRNA(Asn)/Glu-tRNA(Gln) amidotransferase A subunit family amidase